MGTRCVVFKLIISMDRETKRSVPKKRVKGRGFVYTSWCHQQLILRHSSVGCFVTHCGSSSLSESMGNKYQLVVLPRDGDQIVKARILGGDLKVEVKVEKGEEDGLYGD
ncbi:hypothetical protein OIU77_023941 [Salix suchowensis]|uniref:anthocyanidin 3-O-glucosyltransferase n=1 Tax=Salix suchowensis TaxID=1278906 RepID=A0ABQ9C5M1_9ROSI|nr:hypothetical protein OIU77_023941 [Salix suchowensis]